ncbi:MAG: MucBP domain-containing protein [Bacteroidaceae bacterium]|nr:MucBP domain-containing protein [Bacteroidaceae bacterium]
MKKIYFFLSLLLLCFGVTTAQAQSHKVTSIGTPLKDLSTLTAGQQILLFCQGQTDPEHYEYQTRYGFVRELSNNKLGISRKLYDKKDPTNPSLVGSSLSSAYLWTIQNIVKNDNGSVSLALQNDSTGRYISTFSGNDTQGFTGETADVFTMEAYAEAGDTIFSIGDANGIYFNGQNIDGRGGMGDPSKMVGWNEKGGNSNYMIFVPEVEIVSSYNVGFMLYDQEGNINNVSRSVPVGESIAAAPEWAEHDFDAEATEAESGITFPLTPTEDMSEVLLSYTLWPNITINYKDTDNNVLKESVSGRYRPGTEFQAPVFPGYALQSEEYATYTVGSEDDIIDIIYRADATANLPFVPTTIVDGQFADNTEWYTISIRNGNKLVNLNTTTMEVEAGGEATLDAKLWAFVGDMTNGFKIYNKAAGAGRILWADNPGEGTTVMSVATEDATEPNTFDLSTNANGGYSFALHGTTGYWNDYANAGIVKFYGSADAGSKLEFTVYEAPFETSNISGTEFPADTKWYRMKIRDTKNIIYDAESGQIKNVTEETAGLAMLWAFSGDTENGFKIYNYVAGAGKILWGSNEDDPTTNSIFLSTEDAETITAPNTFNYIPNGNGFTWKLQGGLDNKYVNDIAGRLGFWQNGNGAGDGGSKVNFIAVSAEEIDAIIKAAEEAAKAAQRAQYLGYVNAENCVGGWTAEELANLKAHLEAEDFEACAADVEVLPESSIQFDINKKYVLFNAAKEFLIAQPETTIAMGNNGTQVVWKAFDKDEDAFVWSFEACGDSAVYMKRGDMYIGSYRWGTENGATLVNWAENTATDGTFAEGLPAQFIITPSEAYPAAFYFDHYFTYLNGTNLTGDRVWLNTHKGRINATETEGKVVTYKIDEEGYGHAWRMKSIEDAGIDITGIGNVNAAEGSNKANEIYDLSGRRVQKAAKGLYIVNGKKVLVK